MKADTHAVRDVVLQVSHLAFVGLGLWSCVALTVKRLHDLGLSGLHAIWANGSFAVILALVGYFGDDAPDALKAMIGLALLAINVWLIFMHGQRGENRFGPPPGSRRPSAITPLPQVSA